MDVPLFTSSHLPLYPCRYFSAWFPRPPVTHGTPIRHPPRPPPPFAANFLLSVWCFATCTALYATSLLRSFAACTPGRTSIDFPDRHGLRLSGGAAGMWRQGSFSRTSHRHPLRVIVAAYGLFLSAVRALPFDRARQHPGRSLSSSPFEPSRSLGGAVAAPATAGGQGEGAVGHVATLAALLAMRPGAANPRTLSETDARVATLLGTVALPRGHCGVRVA